MTTNVPLASIHDEWSEFVDLKQQANDVINQTINSSTKSIDTYGSSVSSHRNENAINESFDKVSKKNCDKILSFNKSSDKTKDKISDKIVHDVSTLNQDKKEQCNSDSQLQHHSGEDEVEEEFSAFERFDYHHQEENNKMDGKLKVESLENLVATFDEKIVNCFVNYEEPVESLVDPVPILSQEELISGCQMWWRLTENFNQILPVSWERTLAMKFLLPYLIGNKKMDRTSSSINGTSSSRKSGVEMNNSNFDTYTDSNNLDTFDTSLDAQLENQLDDDQFVLSSFGYDYSTCHLHQATDYTYNRTYDRSFNRTTFDRNFDKTFDKTFDTSHDRSRFFDRSFDVNRSHNRTANSHFSSYLNEFESECEEQLARDLDFHSLILCSNGGEAGENGTNGGEDRQLLFTAEEVLKELDIILAEDNEYHLDSTLDHMDALDHHSTHNPNYNSNYYTTYLTETDELDREIAKEESLLNHTIFSNNNKLNKSNHLKPFYGGQNSIGTSFSSNSLDDVLSSGQSMSRSQTSSSQISSGIESTSYAAKSQNEIEIEKQLFEKQLRTLNITQLNEIYLDLERMIQNHSEILISELALKDELEYEKELKNQFISILICIQNKRRKKANPKSPATPNANTAEQGGKYLTTVIPYNSALGPPDTRTLQILIKILKAINEDSPCVPTLLTDFILKVICPTS